MNRRPIALAPPVMTRVVKAGPSFRDAFFIFLRRVATQAASVRRRLSSIKSRSDAGGAQLAPR